jgi:hypothetical protein
MAPRARNLSVSLLVMYPTYKESLQFDVEDDIIYKLNFSIVQLKAQPYVESHKQGAKSHQIAVLNTVYNKRKSLASCNTLNF